MVVAETLPSGLRLVTESMPHVRSVTVGVWLTRGSRHESDAESGVAHFVEHMLFKGTTIAIGARHRADDRLDRRPARRVHGEGIRELLHQGARRAPAARDRSAERHGPAAGARARGRREGTGRHPRRDQDGRGRARRPRARDLRAAVLGRASARPADPRHAGDRRRRSTSDGLRDYFDRTYVAPNLIVAAAGQPRARAAARSGRARVRAACRRGAGRARPSRRPSRRASSCRHKDIEQSHLCIGTPAYPQAHDDRHALYVLNTILGGSMSSRLFQHIREERGLAYAVFSNLTTYSDAGMVTIYAGCADGQGRRGRRPVAGRAARACATAGRRPTSCGARRTT